MLQRAKQTLIAADFVGFYGTLDQDFWHLWRHYFPHTHDWLTAYVPLAFWLGSRLSLPRLEVLKYTATTPETDLAAIRERNQLDLALYAWAVARFRPSLRFYAGYREWMADHLVSVLAMAAGCCVALFSSCAFCYCCCGCCCGYCCRYCCGAWFQGAASGGGANDRESKRRRCVYIL